MGYNVTTPSLVLKGEAPQNAHVFHVLNAKKIQEFAAAKNRKQKTIPMNKQKENSLNRRKIKLSLYFDETTKKRHKKCAYKVHRF